MCCVVNPTTFIPDSRQHRDSQCQKWVEKLGKLVEEGSMLCEKAKATSR